MTDPVLDPVRFVEFARDRGASAIQVSLGVRTEDEAVAICQHALSSPVSAPLGRGFDRWFVFLSKAGISKATIAVLSAAELIGFVLSSLWLLKTLRANTKRASA